MANYDGLASANIKMNNDNVTDRAYDICAEFVVDGNNVVINIINGKVVKDEKRIATFFKSTIRKDVSWLNDIADDEQNAINTAINDFISGCVATITATNPLNI